MFLIFMHVTRTQLKSGLFYDTSQLLYNTSQMLYDTSQLYLHPKLFLVFSANPGRDCEQQCAPVCAAWPRGTLLPHRPETRHSPR